MSPSLPIAKRGTVAGPAVACGAATSVWSEIMSKARLLPLLVLTTFLMGVGPARADQTIATVSDPRDLDAGQGLVVWSALDSATKEYRLMQYSGGVVSRVPVAPSPKPFDPDVGPTASGRPFVVYERCDKRQCDLYSFNPRTGRERRLSVSSKRNDEETASYWHGRLAFVRVGPKGYGIYEQIPGVRGLRRLPALPKRCPRSSSSCVDPVEGFPQAPELQGKTLAQLYSDDDISEVRVTDTRTRRSRQLGALKSSDGEDARGYVDVSLDGGFLYTAVTCFGPFYGCGNRVRFDLSTGAKARSGVNRSRGAFAVADGNTYELITYEDTGCYKAGADEGDPAGDEDDPQCPIVLVEPPARYQR